MRRLVLATALTTSLLLGTTGCGGEDGTADVVTLGGDVAKTMVDRPWGTVPTAPRMEKAETPSEADVVFIAQMLPHHAQALELSRHVLAHDGIDARVKASAEFIAADQGTEMKAMKAWQDAWEDESEHEVRPDVEHDMPGMLTPAQVAEVADLAPDEAEVAFLLKMIEHHEGAVAMSHAYLADAVNSYTLATARHAIREQKTEVEWMRRTVADLCAPGSGAAAPTVCAEV